MKKTVKAILSACLALILALSSLPFAFTANAAEPQPTWTVPDGYNAHDYTKCVEFLEQTDEDGVKNGEKLSESYDPNDPNTWGTTMGLPPNQQPVDRFRWIERYGELRIYRIDLEANIFNPNWEPLVGYLDLAGCTELYELRCGGNLLTRLDLSENANLITLSCGGNQLTELDVSQNPQLVILGCGGNQLTELDVSQNPQLETLHCGSNQLAELDVSHNSELLSLNCSGNQLAELGVSQNPHLLSLYCSENRLAELDVSQNSQLFEFECYGNLLTALDISSNPALNGNHISADGMGFIGYACDAEVHKITAAPRTGAEFIGFYSESGELVSEGEWDEELNEYTFTVPYGFPIDAFIARFSGGSAVTPGDVDSNGSVTVADAILTLRISMQLIDGSEVNVDAADIDGNGTITVADAINILRIALGLE